MKKTTLLALALMLSIGLCNAQKISVKDIENAGITPSKIQQVHLIIDSANVEVRALNFEKVKMIEIRKAQDQKIKAILSSEDFKKYLDLKKVIHEKWKQENAK